jgi:hypothetical protein
LTNKTVDGVTPTTFGYVDPTSSIQTQLNTKGTTLASFQTLAQSTSQSTVTILTAPGAGNYEIHFYVDISAACSTGQNSVYFTFSWTDATLARSLTTGQLQMTSTNGATSFLSGVFPLRVGSGNVSYTSTVQGTCTTGTSTYDINGWAAKP